MSNTVIENVRAALGRNGSKRMAARPAIYPVREPASPEVEIEHFLDEIAKLSGVGQLIEKNEVAKALDNLIAAENIHKATLWENPVLQQLGIADHLQTAGVKLVNPNADKHEMAACDLGITSADYLLPETGTLVLRSSSEQPRGVSLLPRIHLAIVSADMLCADLHQVFAFAKDSHYLVFITGPSRTADIELTVTLGVHGPQKLFVWVLKG